MKGKKMARSPSRRISQTVVEFLNSEFGSDTSQLKKAKNIYEKLLAQKQTLEEKLFPVLEEIPSEVSGITRYAELSIENTKVLSKQQEDLKKEVENHLGKTKSMKDKFVVSLSSIKDLENLKRYLQWELKVEETSHSVEEALKQGSERLAVERFSNFNLIWDHMKQSECRHLINYVKNTTMYWHDILKERFSSEFEKALRALQWPFVSPVASPQTTKPADALIKLKVLFSYLYHIQLPTSLSISLVGYDDKDSEPLLLPLQLMLLPLQKRFIFHFMTKKQTNRLDKPEWYLTKILTWIHDHSHFMEETVQPLLEKEGLKSVLGKMELMKGLVCLAKSKLHADLPELLYEDHLLSHTIDEILLFERELQNQGYPSAFPRLLDILTLDVCFTRWKSLEHKSALEKMDQLLSAETAWKHHYCDESELDEVKVPECAEGFMTLLLTMTERYQTLSKPCHQMSFLKLQLELLDDFRLRLHQMSHSEAQEPLESHFCAILNAVHYVETVLREWSNLPFFIHLHHLKNSLENEESAFKPKPCDKALQLTSSSGTDWTDKSLCSSDQEEILGRTLFDDTIDLLEHMKNDLVQILVKRVLLDVKAKSRPYRKEKWFCLQTVQDVKSLEVSSLAYPLLEVISSHLHKLQEALAVSLFTSIWQIIASELNQYIYEEVIVQNTFSKGGAAQLHCDMVCNLFPIFGIYTQWPENYFKRVKESCILLTLKNAPALLLRETLLAVNATQDASGALEELNIFSLTPAEALKILSLRNDLYSTWHSATS